MKFAHLADVHIGAWRDPAMKSLGLNAFQKAISTCIDKKLDFVIIAGDLFNTAVPAIDHLQEAVILLKKLRNKQIPVYVVPGSHDFNAGGRTIIDVLDEAELLINVMKGEAKDGKLRLKFTVDEKTGAKITGIGGRKGGLESNDYKHLDLNPLESEPGFKVFVFHTSITEMKPDELYMMDSMSANELPKNFDYYAGGHVHIVKRFDLERLKNIVYPGPIFPASFSELWKLEQGGFYIYEDGDVSFHELNLKKIHKIEIDASEKSFAEVNDELERSVAGDDFKGSIVLLKVHGELGSGKAGDIDFKNFFRELYSKGAFFIMRNTSGLTSKEMVDLSVSNANSDELEEEIINKSVSDSKLFNGKDKEIIRELIHAWSSEQNDGEKKYEYDARMKKEGDNILG